MKEKSRPRTPNGQYFVVDGRLWRLPNSELPENERQQLVSDLMKARRAVRVAGENADAEADARKRVNAAKTALGERGPVWWDDGAPDYNRNLVLDTPYRGWFEALSLSDLDGIAPGTLSANSGHVGHNLFGIDAFS